MKFFLGSVLVASLSLAASAAFADPLVRVRRGQFTDRVDQSQPVGDAASIAATGRAVYWLDVANTGQPTTVTLVWRVDGREVRRQTLDVGHSPHWRTWAMHRLYAGHHIEVEVLDAAGASVHHDETTVSR